MKHVEGQLGSEQRLWSLDWFVPCCHVVICEACVRCLRFQQGVFWWILVISIELSSFLTCQGHIMPWRILLILLAVYVALFPEIWYWTIANGWQLIQTRHQQQCDMLDPDTAISCDMFAKHSSQLAGVQVMVKICWNRHILYRAVFIWWNLMQE